jgi:hypothetical protein
MFSSTFAALESAPLSELFAGCICSELSFVEVAGRKSQPKSARSFKLSALCLILSRVQSPLRIENSLHEDQVKPSPKFKADLAEVGDLSKAKSPVELERYLVLRIDRADHDVIVQRKRVREY